MFAGSLQKVTETPSLAIYAEFALPNGFNLALAIGGVLIVISVLVLAALHIALSWQRSSSTGSPSLFGLSTSS
jgi:ABC-type sulfate transport system permease component